MTKEELTGIFQDFVDRGRAIEKLDGDKDPESMRALRALHADLWRTTNDTANRLLGQL